MDRCRIPHDPPILGQGDNAVRRARSALFFSLILATCLGGAFVGDCHAHILKLSDEKYTSFEEMIDDLKGVRLVFMGELHDNEGHHRAQLQVIRALHESGVPVAVGLEMMRGDSQKALDRWVAGEMSEKDFLKVYFDNWSMWPQYREIFLEARRRNISLIGLNISRAITQQVARDGFASLSPEQIGELPGVRCDVDVNYKEYMRRVLGGHMHNNSSFLHFCEAQMLWDTVMAKVLLDFLSTHPDHIVVVLSGSGHAWKYGIPEQIRRQAAIPSRVLLPEIPGRIEAENATPVEADYLMLGLDQGPLH
jgi:uncharacterized iron-regulated protein